MKRRFLTAALGITMALSLAACGSQTNTQNSSTAASSSSTESSAEAETSTESGTTELLDVSDDENASGGWSYHQGDISLDQNQDVKDAFDKALEGLTGADYEYRQPGCIRDKLCHLLQCDAGGAGRTAQLLHGDHL